MSNWRYCSAPFTPFSLGELQLNASEGFLSKQSIYDNDHTETEAERCIHIWGAWRGKPYFCSFEDSSDIPNASGIRIQSNLKS